MKKSLFIYLIIMISISILIIWTKTPLVWIPIAGTCMALAFIPFFLSKDSKIKIPKLSKKLRELVVRCCQSKASSSRALLISWAKLIQSVPICFGGMSDEEGIPGCDGNSDFKKQKVRLRMWFYIIRTEDEGLAADFEEDNKATLIVCFRKEIPAYLKEKFPEIFSVDRFFRGTWEEVLKKLVMISNAVIAKENEEVLEVPALPR